MCCNVCSICVCVWINIALPVLYMFRTMNGLNGDKNDINIIFRRHTDKVKSSIVHNFMTLVFLFGSFRGGKNCIPLGSDESLGLFL